MDVDWELREAGPADAERTVLLLPGGMCSAGSYAEVMAEPALAGTRLVAATLPGQAGAPPPDDYSMENYARLVTELATKVGAQVVVGFSMGACVAFEMVTSGSFTGPVVLLGVSLSSKDEPAFFRGIVQLGRVPGTLPSRRSSLDCSCRKGRRGTDRRRAERARGVPAHACGDHSRRRVLPTERGIRTDCRRNRRGRRIISMR